jgi:multidrug resistance protein MdtO
MIRVFLRNLRLMAELTSDTPADASSQDILKIRPQREQIYRNFGEVNAQSDAVPFETGDRRAGDMAARDDIRRWQASLRTFYLLEVPCCNFASLARRSTGQNLLPSFRRTFAMRAVTPCCAWLTISRCN